MRGLAYSEYFGIRDAQSEKLGSPPSLQGQRRYVTSSFTFGNVLFVFDLFVKRKLIWQTFTNNDPIARRGLDSRRRTSRHKSFRPSGQKEP
jgi:hypothetical protein